MSSTAVLTKLLTERLELDSKHGREVMGCCFPGSCRGAAAHPDPVLRSVAGADGGDDGLAVLKAFVILSLVLYLGQRLMRKWFFIVARGKSAELFMLNVLLITLGLAYLTEIAGLSLALGAFVAGMLISKPNTAIRWKRTSSRSAMCSWDCSS